MTGITAIIIGFFIGYFARWMIAVIFDEYQTNKELREAKIEVNLDRCCKNAYNCGYEIGRLEEQARSGRKLKELYERYANPMGEKVETMDWIAVSERYKAPDSMFSCSECGQYHYVNDNYCPGCGRKYKPKRRREKGTDD